MTEKGYEDKRNKKALEFFGNKAFKKVGENEYEYRAILSTDHIILKTKDVKLVITENNALALVLATAKNKGVYLKPWQVIQVETNGKEGKDTSFLVRLKKDAFKNCEFEPEMIIKGCKRDGGFSGFSSDTKEISFGDCFEIAKRQESEKEKVKVLADPFYTFI